MRRPSLELEALRQRAESAVVGIVAQQASGQRHGVDSIERVEGLVATGSPERRVQEPQIESHVVTDDDGAAHELEQRCEYRLDSRSIGWPGHERVTHHGLQRAQPLTATHQNRAHLDDLVDLVGRASGLEIEHAEGHIGEARGAIDCQHRAAV